jgi:hypothetical protein
MLSQLKAVVPQEWEVLVFADRGISGARLFRHIVSLQWHPFLRLTQRGSVQMQGREQYQPLKQLLREQGSGWCGRVSCFARVQLQCTLLTGQGKGQKEPWIVITDLPAEQAQLAWYQMRYWIECGFKDLKSGGWKWQHSKIKQAHRMQRYLLVMAVSTLWELSQAQSAQEALPVTNVQALPPTHVARRRATGRTIPRELSCLSLGTLWVLRMAVLGQWQMQGRFVAFEWPEELPEATRKPPKKRHQPAKGGKKRWRKRRRLQHQQVA